MTLERSQNIKSFLLNRAIRIYPALLLCSVLTFVFVKILNDPVIVFFHAPLRYFVPSLTFDGVGLIQKITGLEMGFIDGVYWSLTVEVKFYFLAGCLYFASKKNFLRNWLFGNIIILVLQLFFIERTHGEKSILTYSMTLVFSNFFTLFTLGMISYKLYQRQPISKGYLALAAILGSVHILFVHRLNDDVIEKMILFIFVGLFAFFIFKSSALAFLNAPYIRKIGLGSYPLYLLHQNIGVLLIVHLNFLPHTSFLYLFVAAGVILFFCFVSYAIHLRFEKPAGKKLKMRLLAR